MLANMLLVRIFIHQLTLGRLPYQIGTRALMRSALLHRDDRIEENLEVGLGIACGMSSHCGSQMSTCREAHDAYVLRIDVPILSIAAHQSDSLFGILCGYGIMTMRHTIFQYDESNALTIEEGSPVEAFMLHGQMLIPPTGTAHDSAPCGTLLVGQKYGNLRHIVRIAIAGTWPIRPQIHLSTFLCKHHCRYHCQKEKQ